MRQFFKNLFSFKSRIPLNHGADTHHDVASTGHVVSIIQGTHLGLGFVFEVQLHSLYAHVTAPWEKKKTLQQALLTPVGSILLASADEPRFLSIRLPDSQAWFITQKNTFPLLQYSCCMFYLTPVWHCMACSSMETHSWCLWHTVRILMLLPESLWNTCNRFAWSTTSWLSCCCSCVLPFHNNSPYSWPGQT